MSSDSFWGKIKSMFSRSKKDGDVVDESVAVQKMDSQEQKLERIEKGFGELIDQLKGINDNLEKQSNKHQELIDKLEEIPDIIKKFPEAANNQKVLSEKLIETIKDNQEKEREFMNAVERLPAEAMRQTEAITSLDKKMMENAQTNVKVAENFSRFNDSLENFDKATQNNTDMMSQMRKTFASSDRYMKFLVNKQSRKFAWLLTFTIVFSIAVIAVMAGIILYIMK